MLNTIGWQRTQEKIGLPESHCYVRVVFAISALTKALIAFDPIYGLKASFCAKLQYFAIRALMRGWKGKTGDSRG